MADQLWVPPTGLALLRMRAAEQIITLADGSRARVTVDDSGTVFHRERDDGIDALVRPQAVAIRLRPVSPEG